MVDLPRGKKTGEFYLSHENTTPLLSIESWLFNKDPNKGLFFQSPHN